MDKYCCVKMMTARSFDGPIVDWETAEGNYGIVMYKLTPGGNMSRAVGGLLVEHIYYCPFCGRHLDGEKPIKK